MQCTAFVDIAIVRAGLSGLVAAYNLSPTTSFIILEAHPYRLGGRILSAPSTFSPHLALDLGPAWVWPRFQPLLRSLLQSLALPTFPQPDDPSSTRIEGGSSALISGLASQIATTRIRKDWVLDAVTRTSDGVTLTSASNETVKCRHAILAIPPARLVDIDFTPPLSPDHARAAARSQTWMAGVTKVTLLFQQRLWPLDGTSNLAFRRGPSRPAFQVYDAGNGKTSPAALTFFALAPPTVTSDEALGADCAAQLEEAWAMRGWNSECAAALRSAKYKVVVQRWPSERFVADEANPTVVHPHPEPNVALARPE